MNLLILHPNYPGQFGGLATALIERDGWKVVAVGEGERHPNQMRPARYYSYAKFVSPCETTFPPLDQFGEHVRRGRAAAGVLRSLKAKGFHPDVVLAHPGWGDTVFLREVYPRARFIAYLEYFYRAVDSDVDFDPEYPAPPSDLGYVPIRNVTNLLAFAAADSCVTPTQWQAVTFPPNLRSALTILHEGIDTRVIAPDLAARFPVTDRLTLSRSDEVVTFVARSLEPYRGFHVFMRMLPDLLRRRPGLKVLVVGGDGISYGRPPGNSKTWREQMLAEVGEAIDQSRVFFVGRLARSAYLAALRIASVHLYLTYPFVLSWSLLEAMAVGCAIVASSTGPVTEVIRDGENGRLGGFFDHKGMISLIEELLDDAPQRARLGDAARATIIEHYDFDTKTYPRYRSLLAQS